MLELIISGGQTGADQAGWRAARRHGIATGGWMPKGFKTEDGYHPEFAELYEAGEHSSPAYPPRTRANIHWADATLIFAANLESRGTVLAYTYAFEIDKPCLVVNLKLGSIPPVRPKACAAWLINHKVKMLNVAGHRESGWPGIGEWVEFYLNLMFSALKTAQALKTF